MKTRTHLLFLAAVSSVACKETPTAAPDPATRGTAAAAPASAAPRATAGASTSVEATPTSPSAVASAPRAREPDRRGPPTELHLIVDTRTDFSILSGKGGALLVDEDGWALEIRGSTLVQPQGFASGLARYIGSQGIHRAGRVESFGGEYPDHIYALVGAFDSRGTTDHQVHAYRAGTWTSVLASGNGNMSHISDVAPYGSKFVAAMISAPAGEVSFQSEGGPDFTPRKPASGQDTTRLRAVTSLLPMGDGGLVAVGADADGSDEAMEIFTPQGASRAFVPLPDLDLRVLAPASASEIYIVGTVRDARPKEPTKASPAPSSSAVAPAADAAHGKPYFAVYRGGAWTPDTPPRPGAAVTTVDVTDDGTLWATVDGGLWRRPRGGSWISVALPPGAKVTSVVARSSSDVWATYQEKGRLQLYGATAPRWPLVVDAPVGDPPKAVPATPACATPFVLLYAVKPEIFGRAYDFPLTRKAIAGHKELAGVAFVVTEHYQVGAFVPSLEVGEKLATIIRDDLKGQKPQLVCLAPRVRAEIPVDLATGAIARGPLDR